MLKIYLAGPFFNSESKKVMAKLCAFLERLEHEVFSPMRDGIECKKDALSKRRKEVYDLDTNKILWANVVVACLDNPLPIYQRVILSERTPEGIRRELPISFPDMGTIFEIGFAKGYWDGTAIEKARFVIAYSVQQDARVGFNLMITEAVDGFASSLIELENLLALIEANDEETLEALKETKQIPLSEL